MIRPLLRDEVPRLAIIVTCYNYETFVHHAIQSVLDQNRADCEVIVVDDGSTDGSWDVIRQTSVSAFKIENSGQRAACLYGFDQSSAPFVLFLDADDELKPGALGKIISQLDPGVAKLQFPLTQIDADGNDIVGTQSSLETFRSRDDLAHQVLRTGVYKTPPTSGNVFRRDVCELLREVDYDRAVDGVILFAAPFFGDVVSTSEALGRYRIHGHNDSGLGRLPDPCSLRRELDRFLHRMDHLRRILQRLAPDGGLVNAQDTFFFRDRTLYLEVASGRRPRLTALPGLLKQLHNVPIPAKSKIAMAVFYFLATMLPNKRSNKLLAYRLQTGERSAWGFASAIFGR
ncbi:glycosyltransferase [Bradyrhizobium sp. 76]|uniref:glycosyltransferase family 2 protein n=1 Tax=Bradyrhizobium sp. 76 TaxID=2782680 RepID=UPI001FFA9248